MYKFHDFTESGRYKTPAPTWGFIKDPTRYSESLYAYKYIVIDSLDYALQQFIYDEDSEEARIAKGRFDEVVRYTRIAGHRRVSVK